MDKQELHRTSEKHLKKIGAVNPIDEHWDVVTDVDGDNFVDELWTLYDFLGTAAIRQQDV